MIFLLHHLRKPETLETFLGIPRNSWSCSQWQHRKENITIGQEVFSCFFTSRPSCFFLKWQHFPFSLLWEQSLLLPLNTLHNHSYRCLSQLEIYSFFWKWYRKKVKYSEDNSKIGLILKAKLVYEYIYLCFSRDEIRCYNHDSVNSPFVTIRKSI